MGSKTGGGRFAAISVPALSLLAAMAFADHGSASMSDGSDTTDSHAGHRTTDTDVRRSVAEYSIPNVTLLRDDGKSVNLAGELDDGRPVIVNFVYTSCTTICPMSSQVFEQVQEQLGSAGKTVHLVSISIDPEQDTPARLRAYAAQFHAAKGWNHYSGTIAASVAVQRAFDAYRGDKMSHIPLTLLRAAPGKPWVRLDGFARADDLLAERKLWSAEPPPLVATQALVAR
ncbi:MAG: SCO1/SenC [Gammaproteobacteria bacterium]|nr:SCO1/SenC [Gammaproteobacteria bacterium]